jgi:hypothetical protein
MRNKPALALAAVSLVLSGCAGYHTAPTTVTPMMMTFNPAVLPTLQTPPSGARTGRVEAAVGFNTKGFGGAKIKVSEDPLLTATTDTVYWYVDAGNLRIRFDNQNLNRYVACQAHVCYFSPQGNVGIGVYAYTITVENHPRHGNKKLDPDLDIRY